MSCERCGGLMVIEAICDLMEEESHRGIDTRRCLNCGNFEDSTIRANRVVSRLPRPVTPHIVGARRLSATQPRVLERAIQTDGVIAESPRVRAPRLPIGTPSAKTRRLEPASIERHIQIVQTQRRYA